jgi:prepilin-type N-terminal cleavage/methylation domain-containing protein
MHSRKLNPKHRSPRTAFTLVEIMVVIVIIGILTAILVPVIGGIIRRTNEAAVKVEIHSLESAISDFKTKFGCHPPDNITLYELQNGWSSTPEGRASRSKITRIWPRFRFVSPNSTLLTWDVNGDGNFGSGTFTLSGAECLVFFLGGMPKDDGSGNEKSTFMTGFSKNPSNPFQPRTVDESRDGPFFEFPSSRLVDVEVNSAGLHGGSADGFPEFIDTLSNQTAPYLYLSSNEGRGYNAAAAGLVFHSNSQSALWGNHWNRISPYRQTAGGPFWKAKTFQIISPGFGPHENTTDEFCPYGIADVYDPENTNTGALSPQDADNITNFSAGGRMRP